MEDKKDTKIQKENITPEEKLLKIIETPATQRLKVSLVTKARVINLQTVAAKFKEFKIDKNIFKNFNLKMATKGVASLCGLVTIFWIFDFFSVAGNLRNHFEKTIQPSAIAATEEKKISIPPLNSEEILAQLKRRNMFTFIPAPAKTEASLAPDIAQKIANLKLVGIIWSEKPQAMIENSNDQRTYLVNSGERIGQVTIKKIFQDKVVLEVEDQERELR